MSAYEYLYRMYGLVPVHISMLDFKTLVYQHRNGEPVQRDLLAAVSVCFAPLQYLYRDPCELISDVWIALETEDTHADIVHFLEDKKRKERRANLRRRAREVASFIRGDPCPCTRLPEWFTRLPETQQRLLFGSILGENDTELARALGCSVEAVRVRRNRIINSLRESLQ